MNRPVIGDRFISRFLESLEEIDALLFNRVYISIEYVLYNYILNAAPDAIVTIYLFYLICVHFERVTIPAFVTYLYTFMCN